MANATCLHVLRGQVERAEIYTSYTLLNTSQGPHSFKYVRNESDYRVLFQWDLFQVTQFSA